VSSLTDTGVHPTGTFGQVIFGVLPFTIRRELIPAGGRYRAAPWSLIASARRGCEDWWQALDWVRDGLVVGGMLREVEIKTAMPEARPWL